MQDLRQQIMSDLKLLGLPLDFNLDIRGYSDKYNGNYNPNNSTIVIYTLEENEELLNYDIIFETILHEVIHHKQWKHQTNHKTEYRWTHNEDFYIQLRFYVGISLLRGVMKENVIKDMEEVNGYII